jgi:hypothetical protein
MEPTVASRQTMGMVRRGSARPERPLAQRQPSALQGRAVRVVLLSIEIFNSLEIVKISRDRCNESGTMSDVRRDGSGFVDVVVWRKNGWDQHEHDVAKFLSRGARGEAAGAQG